MENLFAALHDQHPGYEVIDVRFLVNKLELAPEGHNVADLDRDLATAVMNAGEPKTQPSLDY